MQDKHHCYQHCGRAEHDMTAETQTCLKERFLRTALQSTLHLHPILPDKHITGVVHFCTLGCDKGCCSLPFISSSSSLFCSNTAFHFASTYMRHQCHLQNEQTREQDITQQRCSNTSVFVWQTVTLIYRRFLQINASKFLFQRPHCQCTLINFHSMLTVSSNSQNHYL